MKKTNQILSLFMAFVLVAALAACGSENGPGEEQQGPDITVGDRVVRYGRDMAYVGNLDVWLTSNVPVFELSDLIFDRLLEKDPRTLELQLSLLEDWPELSEDGLTYTYKLKEGVLFHDGTELTSSDVEYTFNLLFDHERANVNAWVAEMILGAEAMLNGEADSLEGFQVIDDYRFSITLEYPYTAFDTILAVSMLPILPKEARESAGDNWGVGVTIGTGQYIVEEFEPNVKLVLKTNPDYHGTVPNVDGIEVLHMNYDTALIEWEAGNIDVTVIDSHDLVAQYQEKYPLNVHEQEYVGTLWIQLNQDIAPLDDINVRKVLAMATNKDEIANGYLNGYVKIANTLLPSGIPGHNENARGVDYDLDAARDLMAEAGYEDGIRLVANVRSGDTSWIEILQVLQHQYSLVGIELDIQPLDASALNEQRAGGNMQFRLQSWYADYMDGDMFMYSLFHSSNATYRSTGFRDEWFDSEVEQARTLTGNEKIAAYMEMDQYLVEEDFAIIPLYQDKGFTLISDRVGGVRMKKDMLMSFMSADIPD